MDIERSVMSKFRWYEMRCQNCKVVESFPGPKKEDTTWREFAELLKRSPEYGQNHFKYCESCKKMSRFILVAYDAED